MHPRQGRLPAGGFIAIAERTAAIFVLTRFVLRSALRQQRAWREAGVADLPVWVNLAPACLRWEGLIEAVAGELADAGAAPDRLVLEVTETLVRRCRPRQGPRRAAAPPRRPPRARRLRRRATPRSAALRALPMDVVKIDRSFVRDLASDPRDRALVEAMVGSARASGMTPLAEGVETGAQLAVLHELGCTWAQGHLFAPPMPPAALPAWLAATQRRRQRSARRRPRRRRPGKPPASASRQDVGAGAAQPRGWYWLSWYSGICSSCSSVSPDIR